MGKDKVTILLIDHTWMEGTWVSKPVHPEGTLLTDVSRTPEGESSDIPIGKKVLVPWSSILFMVLGE